MFFFLIFYIRVRYDDEKETTYEIIYSVLLTGNELFKWSDDRLVNLKPAFLKKTYFVNLLSNSKTLGSSILFLTTDLS